MWQKYFKVIKIIPGKVVVPKFGTIDFSHTNIPVETCKTLFESDFPYLELTEKGKEFLYGIKPIVTTQKEKKVTTKKEKKSPINSTKSKRISSYKT